jgi:hypothetical protein
MRRRVGGAVLAVAIAWAGSAGAHEGGAHVRGVVKEVAAARLVLSDPTGETVSVALAPDTRITRGAVVVPLADVHPGDRAVVHAKHVGEALQATEIKLGETAAKR